VTIIAGSPMSPTAASNANQQAPAPGSAAPAAANSLNTPGGIVIPSLAPSYEWIYPNSSDGKYFTATQAQLYIGNLFIDELNSLQFTYQGNRIPMFGYCSRSADAFGTGRLLVQGQLAINFVTEGYLYTVLKEFSKINTQPVQASATGQAGAQIASLAQQSQQITNAMQGKLSPSATASYQAQLNIISQQIQSLAAQGGPDAINAAKMSATAQGDTPNAIVLDIPFDIHCELTGAGRTVERVLRHCLLISNEQVYDQSGQTLLDCYGFVARSAN